MGMEEMIEEFVRVINGRGFGERQSFYGRGSGDGDGRGYGFGRGSGRGDLDFDGDGDGYGSGDGRGDSDGSGYSSGRGDSDGSGYGIGYGFDIASYNGEKIYDIDSVPTVIKYVKGNVARGFILQSDLTTLPCYVVKERGYFAHGNTLREAYLALQEKLYNNSTEEERLKKFKDKFPDFSKKYPAYELFSWHHVLTGSCKAGREAFCRDNDIDINKDSFTIYEFVDLTKNSYGGQTILKLLN